MKLKDRSPIALALTLMLLGGCSQVKEQHFIARCVTGRAPVYKEGELGPGEGKVGDYTTSSIPFLFPAHSLMFVCDEEGDPDPVIKDETSPAAASPLNAGVSSAFNSAMQEAFPLMPLYF